MIANKFLLAIAAMIISGASALAAGPYDGSWSGSAVGTTSGGFNQGSCAATMAVDVKDNQLRGNIVNGRSQQPFNGTIGPDGRFKSNGGGVEGTFSGRSFTGRFSDQPNSNCRSWRVTMERLDAGR
jgi:hypothetical protein